MAVKVLELHHHGIRVGPTTEQLSKALTFYRDVLGLTPDPGRPEIPGIPGLLDGFRPHPDSPDGS